MDETRANDVMLRLKRIEGQVRGIQKMLTNEADCTEIINQVAAVRSAIARVGVIVFESHARECLINMQNDDSEYDFDEIITLMSRFIK